MASVSPQSPASPALSPTLKHSLNRRLSSIRPQSDAPTPQDREWASRLMTQQRTESQSSRTGEFTIKEANPVLSKIARGQVPNPTPGLVQVLLHRGADVNIGRPKSTGLLKGLLNVDQTDVRSHTLAEAAQNCSEAIFFILAQHADSISVSEALPACISSGDAIKTSIMLARGADASRLCDLFRATVESGPIEMLEVLLRETRGACQNCRDEGVLRSIAIKNSPKALMLLSKGADVGYKNGQAILSAINYNMEDVAVLALSVAPKKLGQALFDKALGDAYDRKQYKATKACLTAGAKGPRTNATLIASVQQKELSLAKALVQHGANVAEHNGAAVEAAILTRKPEMLQAVLQGNLPPKLMEHALLSTTQIKDLNTAYRMIELLINSGVRGPCIAEALVSVLDVKRLIGDEKARMDLVHLLLSKGQADINLHDAQPVTMTILSGQMDALSLLLQRQPSVRTLELSLNASMRVSDAARRLKIVNMLLSAAPAGSLGHLRRISVIAAAKELLLDVIEVLMPPADSPQNLVVDAFASATSGHKDWCTPNGFAVIYALLSRGASGRAVDDAFCEASTRYHQQAFEIILPAANPKCYDRVLNAILKASENWQSDDNLWLITHLLESGCGGEAVNEALLKALSSYITGAASEDLIDTLLFVGSGADINFKQGQALKIAIRAGDLYLLEKLIPQTPNKVTLSQGLATAILAGVKENVALFMIDMLVEASRNAQVALDLEATIPLAGLSPIAACISVHPKSTALVKRIIDLGCKTETEFISNLYHGELQGEELCTALLWAMAQKEPLSIDVLQVLIKSNANVNVAAPKSGATPLILASRACHKDIVKVLVRAGANTSAQDRSGSTALFYASQMGSLECVDALIQHKAGFNDGSLHEASRHLHFEVVRALVKAKHDPNFSSIKHGGREPLHELAHCCKDVGDMVRIEETIKALMDGKANPLKGCLSHSGKNPLFLAMENENPVPVLQALLKQAMWKHINHADNLFVFHVPKTGTKWFYSPTMYLSTEGLYKGNPKYRDELHRLLVLSQCQDRFYPEYGHGDQGEFLPIAAVGVPQRIMEEDARRRGEEEKRRKREEDHRMKLRHLDEEAKKKGEIDDWRHAQRIEQTQWTHQNDMMQQSENTDLQNGALERKNAIMAAAQQQAELSKVRNAQITVTTLQTQQNLQLDFQQQQAKARIAQQAMQNQLTKEAAAQKMQALSAQQAMREAADRHGLQHQTVVRKKELSHNQKMHAMRMEEMYARERAKGRR